MSHYPEGSLNFWLRPFVPWLTEEELGIRVRLAEVALNAWDAARQEVYALPLGFLTEFACGHFVEAFADQLDILHQDVTPRQSLALKLMGELLDLPPNQRRGGIATLVAEHVQDRPMSSLTPEAPDADAHQS